MKTQWENLWKVLLNWYCTILVQGTIAPLIPKKVQITKSLVSVSKLTFYLLSIMVQNLKLKKKIRSRKMAQLLKYFLFKCEDLSLDHQVLSQNWKVLTQLYEANVPVVRWEMEIKLALCRLWNYDTLSQKCKGSTPEIFHMHVVVPSYLYSCT